MTSRNLTTADVAFGIKSFRMNVNSPIIQVNASECLFITLDHETGGIWYQLDPTKMAIPMENGQVYVAPAGILAIQFDESK